MTDFIREFSLQIVAFASMPIALILFRFIANTLDLFHTTNIERLLLPQHKRAVFGFAFWLAATLTTTMFSTFLWYKANEITVQSLIVTFILASFINAIMYGVSKSRERKDGYTDYFFIIIDNTKWFLIKTTINEEVVLTTSPYKNGDGSIIIRPKSFLHENTVHCESLKKDDIPRFIRSEYRDVYMNSKP